MSNTIQPGYGAQTYSAPAKARETKQAGTQGSSFMDMAVQASRSRADTFTAGLGGLAGMAAMPTSLMMDLVVRSGGQVQAGGTEAVEAPSLETMLKAKYPNIHYHVFDASSGYWRTRNDYPHYLLYQDGDKAKETLENWQPSGANPFYGSIDGRFTAPKEIHALGNVPPGSKTRPTPRRFLRRSTHGLPLTLRGTRPSCPVVPGICPRPLPSERTVIFVGSL